MNRFKHFAVLLTLTIFTSAVFSACNSNEEPVLSETTTTAVASSEETTEPESEPTETTAKPDPTATPTPTPWPVDPSVPELEGYSILWADEFNGDELDSTMWNIKTVSPGYVNAELQAYVDSEENIYVEDGHLVIRATTFTDDKGNVHYNSGKVTGMNKTDFLYGRVEVCAKVPVGQGLWPAIWMMPTVESKYGTWPVCGEIDIMEILCNDPATTYATIHYGAPHAEQQGVYTLENGSFADSFHVFAVEWEPGEIRFYVDDYLVNVCNDWYCTSSIGIERDFPAPFDQLFYVQLNLAVGGNWPGDPDETTDFDNATFEIDYVRVYQKDEYDTNVTKPEPEFRGPDENGNYVVNGDLSDDTDALNDLTDWSFILNQGGEGDASISDGVLTVNTTDAGTVDYSIQLVNWDIPFENGEHYVLTFEACSTEDRNAIVCVTGPNAGYIRYLEDTEIALTTEWQTYTFEFDMNELSDPNGRLEFNMGATDSTASISFRNVSIEMQ